MVEQPKVGEILKRHNTHCIKYDYLPQKFQVDTQNDVLPLWVADMDFPTPFYVVDKLRDRLGHPLFGYSKIPMEEAIASWQQRYGFQVHPDWVVPINSVVSGLNLAVLAFSQLGDRVMLNSPVYPPFYRAISTHGRQVVDISLKKENESYHFDWDNLDDQARIFFLCNPHNPVGRVWSREELIRIGEFCLSNQMVIVADEIHSDLTFSDHHHCPLASISPEFAKITITLNSPSKTFNIAGLAAAYAIIPDQKKRSAFRTLVDSFFLHPNLMGAIATQAAYQQGGDWPGELMRYLQINRDYVLSFLKAYLPDVEVVRPQGTYLLWLDFSNYTLPHGEIQHKLLYQGKIALSSGQEFQREKFFRLNLATSLDNLRIAMDRLAKISFIDRK